MAKSLIEAEHTSIHERLYAEKFDAERLEAYLTPLWDNESQGTSESDSPDIRLDRDPRVDIDDNDQAATSSNKPDKHIRLALKCTLKRSARQLNLAIIYLTHPDAQFPDRLDNWMAKLLNRERKNRAQAPAFFDYA